LDVGVIQHMLVLMTRFAGSFGWLKKSWLPSGSSTTNSRYLQNPSLTERPRASISARNASSAATSPSCVGGSTLREMNVSPLPTFSGHWSERITAQPARSTCAARTTPLSSWRHTTVNPSRPSEKRRGGLDVRDVMDGTGKPVGHDGDATTSLARRSGIRYPLRPPRLVQVS
jgi:hypothetical protein